MLIKFFFYFCGLFEMDIWNSNSKPVFYSHVFLNYIKKHGKKQTKNWKSLFLDIASR